MSWTLWATSPRAADNSQLEATSLRAEGSTSSTAYDSLGDPISIINPLGQQTTATYNSTFDELQSITDPNGNTLDYSYDATNGNLQSVTYPDGTSQQYAYDALGQVTQFINRDGQAIAYTYNASGLIQSETLPDGTQDTFTYDDHDNLVSMTDSTGTTTFAYDSGNRLTKVTYPDGTFLQYTYNAAGQRIQMTRPDRLYGQVPVRCARAALGADRRQRQPHRLVQLQCGRPVVQRAVRQQMATDYTYDADGDVLSIVNLAPDGSTQSSYAYTYNNQGSADHDDDIGRDVHLRLRRRRPAHLGPDARRPDDHLRV